MSPPTVQCGGWFPRGLPGLSRAAFRGPLSFLLPAVVFCRHHFGGELRLCVRMYVYVCACVCVRVCVYARRFASRAIIVTGGTPLTRACLEIARDTGSTTDEARSSQSIAIDGGSIADSRDPDLTRGGIQRRSSTRTRQLSEYAKCLIFRRESIGTENREVIERPKRTYLENEYR